MTVQTTALILAWVAIAILALAMSGLLRQVHVLSSGQRATRVQVGPPVGRPAPPLNGESSAFTRDTVLLFVDSDCASCQDLLPEFEKLAADNTGYRFMTVFPGSSDGFDSSSVQVLSDNAGAFERFAIPATPFGVIVGDDGVIKEAAPIGSSEMLEAFVSAGREGSTDR